MAITVDIWMLVFEQLAGDYTTLRNVSLVSRAWRTLSWPCLLQVVDLSSHNIEGRLTEHENESLVPRQRHFLCLILSQPALAKHVKSLTWTLVWQDIWKRYDVSPLLDIDRKTWNVFSRLVDVTSLDLASLHDVWDDPIVRENPTRLFPKVTDLRLLGWMHRGLVNAILGSIDSAKLRNLRLDFLEDQGELPGGQPVPSTLPEEFITTGSESQITNESHILDDEMLRRQECGEAAIFPGPMWYPLRVISNQSMVSLSHLQLSIPQLDWSDTDIRAYHTMFRDFAKLLRKASASLRSLVVILGEDHSHYHPYPSTCGTGRAIFKHQYTPWCIKMTACFLVHVLSALNDEAFPHLDRLRFEGFHLLESEQAGPDRGGTLSLIQASRFNHIDFTGTQHIDARVPFRGFDECDLPDYDQQLLHNS